MIIPNSFHMHMHCINDIAYKKCGKINKPLSHLVACSIIKIFLQKKIEILKGFYIKKQAAACMVFHNENFVKNPFTKKIKFFISCC